VIIVSEEHDVLQHHANQLAVLHTLGTLRANISVGLEFLYYPDQPWVDRFVQGDIQEPEFLQAVDWQGYPFEWYRPLVLFAKDAGGQTLALNAPPRLTRAQRFETAVGQHGRLPEGAVQNFFAAQSAWDDTMAWQAQQYVQSHPGHVVVIIVGDFHVSYGGGLPDRLRARGVSDVLVISQVNRRGLSDDVTLSLLGPDPRYGARADFVWLTDEEPEDEAPSR
jgi:uncharacterized iron-regulated protein